MLPLARTAIFNFVYFLFIILLLWGYQGDQWLLSYTHSADAYITDLGQKILRPLLGMFCLFFFPDGS